MGRREGKAPGFALPKRFSLRVGGIGRLGVLTPSPIGRLGEKVSEDLGRKGAETRKTWGVLRPESPSPSHPVSALLLIIISQSKGCRYF